MKYLSIAWEISVLILGLIATWATFKKDESYLIWWNLFAIAVGLMPIAQFLLSPSVEILVFGSLQIAIVIYIRGSISKCFNCGHLISNSIPFKRKVIQCPRCGNNIEYKLW